MYFAVFFYTYYFIFQGEEKISIIFSILNIKTNFIKIYLVRATRFKLTLGKAENKFKKQSKLMVAQRLSSKFEHFSIE